MDGWLTLENVPEGWTVGTDYAPFGTDALDEMCAALVEEGGRILALQRDGARCYIVWCKPLTPAEEDEDEGLA